MPAHHKLNDAQIASILERYRAGTVTQSELAHEYGVTNGTINFHLQKHGVRPPNKTQPQSPAVAELARLIASITPGDWVDDALCAQTDPEAFFPEKGGSTREAKSVCAHCPVRPECLEFALESRERFGIWGGASERDRRRLEGPYREDGAA